MRSSPFEARFIATIDGLLGLTYLLLRPSFFTGRGFRIPLAWLPLHAWGALYLIVALGMLARLTFASVIGVAVNVAFGLGLLWAFASSIGHANLHSSPVGGLLLLGWAARHFLTGRDA